jgi:hypothetical protein
MSITEIIPAVRALSRSEKLDLAHMLLEDLATEDQSAVFKEGHVFPIYTPEYVPGAAAQGRWDSSMSFGIDFLAFFGNNQDMNTAEKITDTDALLEHLATGKPLDDETRRRILERGERISEELRQTYGEMNIAVDLIREIRDES